MAKPAGRGFEPFGRSLTSNNPQTNLLPSFDDYKMPENVENVLARGSLTKPPRDQMLRFLLDVRSDFAQTLENVDNSLRELLEKLEDEYLYLCAVDLILWAGTLKEFFDQTSKGNALRWVTDRILLLFDKELANRDRAKLKRAAKSQLDMRNLCWPAAFEAVFQTKQMDLFFRNFCTEKIAKRFVDFISEKLEVQTTQAFRWIAKLKLYRYSDKFSVKNLVYYALTKHELNGLLEICKTDESKSLPGQVVIFLDKIVGSFFRHIDLEAELLESDTMINAIRRHDKEIVTLVFTYVKTFQMSRQIVENCVFVRRMNAFIRNFKDHQHTPLTPGFYQKAIYTMGNDRRGRHAGLTFLVNNGARETAIQLAISMNMDRDTWPSRLVCSTHEFKEMQEKVFQELRAERDEQEQIRSGFNLLRTPGVHTVHLIDTKEAVNNILKPFIEDSQNSAFGFDQEGDQSFCGEMGSLCLVQFTGRTQTMLVDIHAFKKKYQWTDEEFLGLFKLLFQHHKPIYGFGFENDLKCILKEFPQVKNKILPELRNLVCLYTSFQILREIPELCDPILGPKPSDQLNLSAMTHLLLSWKLDKEEQASVWSHRPLRKVQQRYAAQDAFAVLKLAQKLEDLVKTKTTKIMEDGEKEQDFNRWKSIITGSKLIFPDKLPVVFAPFVWMNEGSVVPNCLQDAAVKKKTKCNQFSSRELETLIHEVNSKLRSESKTSVDVDTAFYVGEQMCSQLGACLRRIGVNARTTDKIDHILDFMNTHPSAKILTSNKGSKRPEFEQYKLANRLLNVPLSTPLDGQLAWLLEKEELSINLSEMRPRCIKCSGQRMIYVPSCALKYMHYRLAIEKSLNWDISVEDVLAAELEMNTLDPFSLPNEFCAVARGDMGFTLTINSTLIFLDQAMMRPPKNHPADPERLIKLSLAMHRSVFNKNEDQTLSTVKHGVLCLVCGKENVEFGGDL